MNKSGRNYLVKMDTERENHTTNNECKLIIPKIYHNIIFSIAKSKLIISSIRSCSTLNYHESASRETGHRTLRLDVVKYSISQYKDTSCLTGILVFNPRRAH